jgi:flavin-binding protein dodecin
MAVVKIIEVISEGKSIEAAMEAAVTEVTKTVQHVNQINVVHIEGVVEKNKITKYRVNANLSFVVDPQARE